MKDNAEKKWKFAFSPLKDGNTILIKSQQKGKLILPFNPEPYEVEKVKGSMITAKRSQSD
jgi:hypothetical protein